MKTMFISGNGVNGSVYMGSHVSMMLCVNVYVGDNYYTLSQDDYGNLRLTVAAKGWPRKVKMTGPTARKVLARAMFPQAA